MKAFQTKGIRKLLIGCVVWLAFHSLTADKVWGASNPGPAIGTRVDRTYDDGFVLVDASGNNADYTWYWGYENSSQFSGGVLRFHSVTYTGLVATVLTDTFDLEGNIPPPAPYHGTFSGPGPLIFAEPYSRSVTNILLTPVFFTHSNTNLLLRWQGFTNGRVEVAPSLTPPMAWVLLTNLPTVISNQTQVAVPKSAGTKFYHVRFLP